MSLSVSACTHGNDQALRSDVSQRTGGPDRTALPIDPTRAFVLRSSGSPGLFDTGVSLVLAVAAQTPARAASRLDAFDRRMRAVFGYCTARASAAIGLIPAVLYVGMPVCG